MFPAEKEWDRPRIIIDNNCTMPSRVRAILYNECREELVERMADSIHFLVQRVGAKQIILACNTSHLFLEEVYEIVPEAKGKIVNIIDACVQELHRRGANEVYLLATEATIVSGVYEKKLEEAGIKCISPEEKDFARLRECIEAVKQDKYNDEVKQTFVDFVNRRNACILGCTELPILYEKCRELVSAENVYNPLYIALKKIYKEYTTYLK